MSKLTTVIAISSLSIVLLAVSVRTAPVPSSARIAPTAATFPKEAAATYKNGTPDPQLGLNCSVSQLMPNVGQYRVTFTPPLHPKYVLLLSVEDGFGFYTNKQPASVDIHTFEENAGGTLQDSEKEFSVFAFSK